MVIVVVWEPRAHSEPLRSYLGRIEACIDTKLSVAYRLLVLHALVDFLLCIDAELGIVRSLIIHILTVLLTLSRS